MKKLICQMTGIIITDLLFVSLATRLGWDWDSGLGWFTIFLIGFITCHIIGEIL